MASVTDLFRDIHRLRRHARELQNEIDLGPRVLKEKQQERANEEGIHKECYDAVKRLKLKLKEDEGTLKQVEQHLDKLGTRAMQVTTMKEMEATKHETEIAQAKKAELEDAILAGMSEIEERIAKHPQDEARWKAAQAEFAKFEIDAKERYERIVEDLGLTQAKLAERDAALPPDIKSNYDRLIRTYGPDGLAAVKGKVCQQCRAGLTDQQVINLQAGRYMVCPRCGRALYPDSAA